MSTRGVGDGLDGLGSLAATDSQTGDACSRRDVAQRPDRQWCGILFNMPESRPVSLNVPAAAPRRPDAPEGPDRLDERALVRLSKSMSKALRHRPDRLGLELDSGGWVDVSALVAALSTEGRPVSRAMVDEVVRRNDKKRFSYDATGTRIRANQGHSVAVDLGLAPTEPPAVLYHGTVARSLPAIRGEGLRPMQRHHVHLSADEETGNRVGARRGAPVVLVVDAASMAADGHLFWRSDNGVWLAESVPPRYLIELEG